MVINYPDAPIPNTYQNGVEFQDFVCEQLIKHLGIVCSNYQSSRYQLTKGENEQGIEIKLDRRMSDTKRLSIEIAEKSKASNNNFIPSGIYRRDNTWLYIQGNYNILYIFSKTILKILHNSGRYEIHTEPTVKGFFLPFSDANKYAAKVIIFKTEA